MRAHLYAWLAAIFFLPVSSYSQIPIKAYAYAPTISAELSAHFPEIPYREYVPGLIEKESCITLKHSKCWNSYSRLKTYREEGAGLGQLTRAYNEDGSIRFDKLQEMTDQYPQLLKNVSWKNIYQSEDAQIRIIVLMLRDSYKRLPTVTDPYERTAMMDAAYNGGLGSVFKERRICGLTKGCDSTRWFGHVEKYCSKSKRPNKVYGNRSMCDIHRDHVKSVLQVKMPKYREGYFVK